MTSTEHQASEADRRALADVRQVAAAAEHVDVGLAERRAAYDEMTARTPLAEGIEFETASVGDVPGFWCRVGTAPSPLS